MALHGVLLVDKPVGITSFDVLRRLRKVLKTKSLGHAGTLDPFASGLLVVCVGDYTRFAGYLTDDSKAYQARLKLGERTDSDDCDGEIVETRPLPERWTESLEHVLPKFRGTIQQVPPIFSAIHVDGKRAYALAREGKEVQLEAREITVETLDVLAYYEDGVELFVEATKGTYIRSLARDIGNELSCGGHLVGLRRVRSGGFSIDDAVTLDALEDGSVSASQALLHDRRALPGLSSIVVDEDAKKKLYFGQLADVSEGISEGMYVAFDQADGLVGLVDVVPFEVVGERRLKARRLLPQMSTPQVGNS